MAGLAIDDLLAIRDSEDRSCRGVRDPAAARSADPGACVAYRRAVAWF
ncbi:MAG: hypothetical protein P4L48_05220 [Mycobacterium sp.]|nr:hypothetical protein [Mycobacterium sp.]